MKTNPLYSDDILSFGIKNISPRQILALKKLKKELQKEFSKENLHAIFVSKKWMMYNKKNKTCGIGFAFDKCMDDFIINLSKDTFCYRHKDVLKIIKKVVGKNIWVGYDRNFGLFIYNIFLKDKE